MAVGLVTAIVCAGISREQSEHEIRHPRALAPQQDMGMVGHQCPGIGGPVSFAKLPIRETKPLFLPMLAHIFGCEQNPARTHEVMNAGAADSHVPAPVPKPPPAAKPVR